MKIYKRLTIITTVVSVLVLIEALYLQYEVSVHRDVDFWINVCLGLFGSAALTALTAVVSYSHEKIKTLENFLYHTRQILSFINKYDEKMTLEEKLQFFLAYHDLDKIAWDCDYGNIDFFFEALTKNREYIYHAIYSPIVCFNKAASEHIINFRAHLNGTVKNEKVMQSFVAELEKFLLEKFDKDVPTEYDDNGNPISFCHYSATRPKLTFDIKRQLSGRYYNIMYGKRVAHKMDKIEKAEVHRSA